MEFIDLKTQYLKLKNEIDQNIQQVLSHGKYIMGPEVAELESELCEYTGSQYCITCANGTDALQMALMAYGISAGDAVLVPSFTFMSTAEVVTLVGATPVFVDIDPDTFNIDPTNLEDTIERITKEGVLIPRAIIPVDLFGQCADYPEIMPIAKKHHLIVIEDAAQGFGGTIKEQRACSFGDISTTSFFPAKPLGCYGDGGALFTDNEDIFNQLISIRIHGKGSMKYENIRIGLNSRLDTLQAAILLPKLSAFKEYELKARQKSAKLYSELLGDTIKTPVIKEGFSSSWAQYTIKLTNRHQREQIQIKLKNAGIPSNVYYPKPLHRQPAYQSLGYFDGYLPNAENASKCVLSLPMHPYMTEEIVGYICKIAIESSE